MTTASTSCPASIQHRATLPTARGGFWPLVKAATAALVARRSRRLPAERLDDHMLRDIGIDPSNVAVDPRDLILRL